MSELENKANDGSGEVRITAPTTVQKMIRVRPWRHLFYGSISGMFPVGLAAVSKIALFKKEQPFNFDHSLHVEETGDCETCHFLREDGTFSGIPGIESCMECHTDEPMGETDDEAVFVEEYVAQGKEVPWLIYARQPDCVYFSHAAHTVAGGMDCKACHGHIGESSSSRPYEENRITGYSRDIWGKISGELKRIPGIA